jgi:hypothetical protein
MKRENTWKELMQYHFEERIQLWGLVLQEGKYDLCDF